MTRILTLACLVGALATPCALAQIPVDVTSPGVATSRLETLLGAVTKAEDLAGIADTWWELVEDKDAAAALAAANDDDTFADLEKERDALRDRLRVVIAALKSRGMEDKASEIEGRMNALKVTHASATNVSQLWTKFTSWLTDPDGGIKWGLRIVLFFFILFAARIASNILGKVAARGLKASKLKTSDLLCDFFVNSTKKVVFFIGIIIALGTIGIDIGPFLAGLGVLGFVVGFALQGTLGNFASGIMILLYRPYDVGDVITVAGETGTVSAMSLVSTTLLLSDNQVVVIPNGSIWDGVITNITGNSTRRVNLVFGIGYDDDVEHAERVLAEIVNGHEKVLKDPAPLIRLHELGDSSVNFVCRPWTKTSDYWEVYWDLTREVKMRFDKEGISIPYPQQDTHVHGLENLKGGQAA